MRKRFRLPWRSASVREAEINEEIVFHLALRTEELVRAGLTERAARTQALAEFGDVAGTRRYCLRQDAVAERRARWGDRVRDGWRDVRIAARCVARQRVLALAVIGTLALGVSGTTALWTVVRQLLLHPFDVRDADRLVVLQMANGASQVRLSPHRSMADLWREEIKSFEAVEWIDAGSATATDGAGAERVSTASISESFLGFVGKAPRRGRGFTRDDRVPGALPVALLGYGFWQRRYGGDDDVLQRTIRLDTTSYTIVGVMPATLRRAPGAYASTDVWLPAPDAGPDRPGYSVARLVPGIAVSQAQAELSVFDDRHAAEISRLRTWRSIIMTAEDILGRSNVRTLLLLLWSAGLVLLLSAANVSHLLLGWSAARRRESAVRAALGGSGRRLVSQSLLEVGVMGLAGGVLGLLAAGPFLSLLVRFRPPALSELEYVSLDGVALGTSLAVGLLAALIAGMVPAWRSRGVAPTTLLHGARASGGPRSAWTRQFLVGFEVAASVLVLIAAGLIGRSLWRLQHTEVGFSTEGLVAASWELPAWRFADGPSRRDVHQRILAGARSEPGMVSAALASGVPPRTGIEFGTLAIAGRTLGEAERESFFASSAVSPEFFATMGIDVVAGRGFDPTVSADPDVVVINRGFAERFWPGADPLGHEIRIGEGSWSRIVGVVENVPALGLGMTHGSLQLYRPLNPDAGYMTLVARTTLPLGTASASVRSIVRAADPAIPVNWVESARAMLQESVARQRFSGVILAGFGLVALLLYAGGLFGVLNFSVTQRTREIGIRVALGADPRRVRWLVVRQALWTTTIGTAVGIAGAWAGARLIRSLLYEVSERDTATFATAVVITFLATLWASYRPARRASRLDPVAAIREE